MSNLLVLVVKQVLDSSNIAQKVFADLAGKMNLESYFDEVKAQVKILDDNNFSAQDVC